MRQLNQTKYSTDDIVETLKKISPISTNKTPIRIGGLSDGGYILLEELLTGTINYSFGVGNVSSFEKDMASRGYTNYMYDHTISPSKLSTLWENQFKFKNIGIGAENTNNLKTIETIIKENGHVNKNNLILQCDVEGAEYDIFTNTPQKILKCFSQIIIEYHSLDKCILNLTHFKRGRMEYWYYDKMKTTFNVLKENFTPYHVHGNNFRSVFEVKGQAVPEVIEVSYVRNDLVEFNDKKQIFPTLLDRPNWDRYADLELGSFTWN